LICSTRDVVSLLPAGTAEGDKAFGAILDVAVEVVNPILEEGAGLMLVVVGTMEAVEVVGSTR